MYKNGMQDQKFILELYKQQAAEDFCMDKEVKII